MTGGGGSKEGIRGGVKQGPVQSGHMVLSLEMRDSLEELGLSSCLCEPVVKVGCPSLLMLAPPLKW